MPGGAEGFRYFEVQQPERMKRRQSGRRWGRGWKSAVGATHPMVSVCAEYLPAARPRDAEPRSEMHQLGHGASLHLRHHVSALFFDGRFAGAELAGDLLVEQTGDDACQHIALSWGKRSVPAAKLRAVLAFYADRPVALDTTSNGVEQLLLAEWVRQEFDRARFHGPDRHGNVAVAGDEDDRQLRVRLDELALQIEPAQPRQAHVEDEASRRIRTTCVQERPRAGKHLDLESDGRDEPPQRVAHRRIVVDHEDDRSRRRRVGGGAPRYVRSSTMRRVAHSQLAGTSARCHLPPRAGNLPCSSRRVESAPYSLEERGAPDRLLQERGGARLERTLAHVIVAMCGQNDHRDPRAGVAEISQEAESTHPGHPQIEHETAGPVQRARLQEHLRGFEGLDTEPCGHQKISE